MKPENRRFRLYIDESGDHTFKLAESDNHRYLGLLGIWFDSEGPYRAFAQSFWHLKSRIFGWHPDDSPICFHRKDIIERRRIFGRLRDPQLNERFEAGLLQVVSEADFHLACVVIDKASHRTKTYRELFHPLKREMVAERRGEEPPKDFSAALLEAARPKMNCQTSTRKVAGYGKIWLD